VEYYFIGEGELLTAFRFTGIDGTAVSNQDDAIKAFHSVTAATSGGGSAAGGAHGSTHGTMRAVPSAYKILILTEQSATWIGEELNEWQLSGKYPLIVELPGLAGKIPGRKNLVDSIREAIGIHV
jgi:V/A-type H+-transporting ATPase subunit F